MKFSSVHRAKLISTLRKRDFDLIVIGGGITGAGIALDAASRGLKTALIEKSDFASGTSSRSTKLIHGGLRYLKQLEFALVKEVGSERAVVHKLAPYLVIPEKMLLPLREKRGFGSLLTSFGLKLYDWLAGVTGKDRRLMLTRRQTLRREPLLKKEDVKGGALYAEYRTDDARLTLEVVKKAVKYGAIAVSYCEVTNLHYDNGRNDGVHLRDMFLGDEFIVYGRVIVNATGPWVDNLRVKDKSREGKRLHLTKGVHIVVPKEKFPVSQSIYFDIKDGRMIFAIPRGRVTYVGTTDTNFSGEIDDVRTTREDAQYLIDGVNENFPGVALKITDVESSWAGLRPLIHEDGKSASALSRKDEIFISPSGLYSIAGGKLTGYRKMAERIVDMILEKKGNNARSTKCYTQKIKLGDGQLTNSRGVKRYLIRLRKRITELGLASEVASYLVENYGKQAEHIVAGMEKIDDPDAALRLIKSELRYTVAKEMVCTANDFFIRRTGSLYFDIGRVLRYKDDIVDELAVLLNWDEQVKKNETIRLDTAIQQARSFLKD